jgi:TRAP-type C4-dicarboxylate transport system substrate-binding protein
MHARIARTARAAATGLAAALLAAPGLAGAQETINLTIVSGFPPVSAVVKNLQEFYIPEVNKALAGTKYRIKWNEAFAGTVAKPGGELDAIRTGIADMGIVLTPAHADKIPLYNIGFVTPFTSSDMKLLARAVDHLTATYPQMQQAWAKQNQVYLGASGVGDDYLILSSKPINGLGDLKGMKIGGIGLNLRWVQSAGAVGVVSNLAEFYNATKTGVVDGVLMWGEAAINQKMYEVAPNMLQARLGGATAYAMTVNADVWKKLPPEVKKVLQEKSTAFGQQLGAYVMQVGANAPQRYRDAGGKVVPLSDADRLAWAKQMPNIAKEWAAGLDKQGLPGDKILASYMDFMRANNQPIARHWDKE